MKDKPRDRDDSSMESLDDKDIEFFDLWEREFVKRKRSEQPAPTGTEEFFSGTVH